MRLFSLFIFALFAVLTSFSGEAAGMVGNARVVDIGDEGVVEAAHFASKAAFPSLDTEVIVVSATKQVVAGLSYNIIAEVRFPDGSCEVRQFGVWNRFGDLRLTDNEIVGDSSCL